MNILILSCSLNPSSRSRILANEAADILRKMSAEVRVIDLREHPLPMCDGESCDPEKIKPLKDAVSSADAILVAAPIYNYDVNAAAKNVVELTGSAWREKIVGFICAAGGHGSYMSIMSLANSLMLDFRCLIVPRFVYATDEAFDDQTVTSPKIRDRLQQLCSETMQLATAMKYIKTDNALVQ